jgi:phosphoglycolate phosphatase-like HAD superfamily hydrolase
MEDCPSGKSKPDPYGLKLALQKLKRAGGFYIGDSGDDMLAAKAAGLTAIEIPPAGISSSGRSSAGGSAAVTGIKEKLQAFGADLMLDTLERLEQVIV